MGRLDAYILGEIRQVHYELGMLLNPNNEHINWADLERLGEDFQELSSTVLECFQFNGKLATEFVPPSRATKHLPLQRIHKTKAEAVSYAKAHGLALFIIESGFEEEEVEAFKRLCRFEGVELHIAQGVGQLEIIRPGGAS